MRRAFVLLLGMVLLSCTSVPEPMPSATDPQPNPKPGEVVSVPSQLVQEPHQAPSPPMLSRTEDGFRLKAESGALGGMTWVDSSHLLVRWFPSPEEPAFSVLLIDLNQARVIPVLRAQQAFEVIHPEGLYALLLAEDESGKPRLLLLDTSLGNVQTIIGPERTAWTELTLAAGTTAWQLQAFWTGGKSFVLSEMPAGKGMPGWGKQFFVDIARRQVLVLAEAGQVVASFPDGSLLTRQGWVDGELQILSSDRRSQPQVIAPGGPWTWGFAVSPGGDRLAWMELTPPPGDWSQRLPQPCCSGDPRPRVDNVVIWSRATGLIERFPATGAQWPQELRWRKNGSGILLAVSGEHTALLEISVSGKSTRLAEHAWPGELKAVTEGPDGSVYYTVTGGKGANWLTFAQTSPGGAGRILEEGYPTSWQIDAYGRWIRQSGEGISVHNLVTGEVVDLPGVGVPSPDSRAIVSGGLPTDPLLVIIRRGR